MSFLMLCWGITGREEVRFNSSFSKSELDSRKTVGMLSAERQKGLGGDAGLGVGTVKEVGPEPRHTKGFSKKAGRAPVDRSSDRSSDRFDRFDRFGVATRRAGTVETFRRNSAILTVSHLPIIPPADIPQSNTDSGHYLTLGRHSKSKKASY